MEQLTAGAVGVIAQVKFECFDSSEPISFRKGCRRRYFEIKEAKLYKGREV